MDTTRHHAIIVSSWDKTQLKDAHRKAINIFSIAYGDEQGGTLVSNIVQGLVYPQSSFFIAPCGLEKHTRLSEKGDEARKAFMEWLKEFKNYCQYIEIAFGGNKLLEEITRCSSRDTGIMAGK